jgi:ElaB/YqjD/DUF883 family membrane-anchored ribosome-binding protein
LIAEELARRSRTEHLKAEASALRTRVTAQVKSKANEKKDALKQRAMEAARERALTLKETVMAKPVALAIAGGVAGALVGAFLGRRSEESQHYVKADTLSTGTVQPPGWSEEVSTGPSVGERAQEAAGEAKERLSEAVDETRERLSGAMDRAKEKASSIKERAKELRHRAGERIGNRVPSGGDLQNRAGRIVREDPAMLAFAALAAGACVGLLLPLTDTERRALRGAHEKAKEGLQSGFAKAQEALDGHPRGAEAQANEDVEVESRGSEAGIPGFEPPAIH